MLQQWNQTANPSAKGLLASDAVHLPGFFADIDCPYEKLLSELKKREQDDGVQKTYWRPPASGGKSSEPSVTRVKHLPDAQRYPVHSVVVQRMATCFGVHVQGWWVNHYGDGSAVKKMHRDGWGRDRGVNITIGASFGSDRSLRFEAAERDVFPQEHNFLQKNGDIFAFGQKVNHSYRHGVLAESGRGPRISVIIMGQAPDDWARRPNVMQAPTSVRQERSSQDAAGPCRRRWGQMVDCTMEKPRIAPSSPVADNRSPPTTQASSDPDHMTKNTRTTNANSMGDHTMCNPRVTDASDVGDSSVANTRVEQASNRWRGRRQNDSSMRVSQSLTNCTEPSVLPEACIVWCRDDLRLADNPALHAAVHSGFDAIVPTFIHDTADPNPWPVRGAALWWKGESMKAFESSLVEKCCSRLILRAGDVIQELLDIAKATNARSVYFNRQVEPWYHDRDLKVQAHLEGAGLTIKSFKAATLQEPWEGSPPPALLPVGPSHASMYDEVSPGKMEPLHAPWGASSLADQSHVTHLTLPDVASIINADRLLSNPNPCAQLLTAIGEDEQDTKDSRRRDPDHFLVYKALESGDFEARVLPSVSGFPFPSPREWPSSLTVEDLGYLQTAGHGFPTSGMPQCSKPVREHEAGSNKGDWADQMRRFWTPGESAALSRIEAFVSTIDSHKRPDRHRADLTNTSLLSPHLRFGEITPRQCYVEAMRAPAHLRHGFIRRVLWRDLSYAELYKWPDLPKISQRLQYEEQWWSGTETQLKKWQHGKTGFPLIDAGMRQLWREGYINNYMRHITAGFLIDYLDISWKSGFDWYDYTLVDSDAAINARLWQQGGHSGVSQWNFVMHPVFAAKNADPTGDYVRNWVPELAGMPTSFIHRPWEAPLELLAIGVRLGSTYPRRMLLDLAAARRKHLRNVLAVRAQHPEFQSSDGTEYMLLRDGSRVLLRTRDDIRQDTDELIVAQTADDALHGKLSAGRGKSALTSFQQCLMDGQSTVKSMVNGHDDLHIL